MFAAIPFSILGLGDGDGDADAESPAAGSARATGSAAGLESFWSDAGAVSRLVEACGACVEAMEPEDGKSDGKESTSPPSFAGADGAEVSGLVVVGGTEGAISEAANPGIDCWD